MKVWLDDLRPAPAGWVATRWPEEAIALLEAGQVREISLDHDLGDDLRGTGYDVLLWLEEAAAGGLALPDAIHIHTDNASARGKMMLAVRQIHRIAGGQQR